MPGNKGPMIKVSVGVVDVNAPSAGSGLGVQVNNETIRLTLTHPLMDANGGPLTGLAGVEWVKLAGPDPGDPSQMSFEDWAKQPNSVHESRQVAPVEAGTSTEYDVSIIGGAVGLDHHFIVRWFD